MPVHPGKPRQRAYTIGTAPSIRNRSGSNNVKKDLRLRSGSTGQRQIPDDEFEDSTPIQFSAKSGEKKAEETTQITISPPPYSEDPNGQTPVVEENGDMDFEMNFEDDERGGWGNKLDFLFSCISVSVGLGNVWRFPYLCYKNGGGTFLIIYAIAMFACGIPVFFQEVAAGQYLGSGGATIIGQFVPILQGVGYATMTIVFFLDIYYCIIIAWTLFYLINSFVAIPDLPWGSCGNYWNSDDCYDAMTMNGTSPTNSSKTPVEEYWDRRVLQITSGMDDMGGMQWELFGCLILGWLIVYGIIWKGLHSSGKIIWFTALFPYFVMTILFFRAVTLPGAEIGLWKYIQPDWEKFYDSETWIDSATQIFFAYSIGTGALPALGSYNKFHHNCVKDAIITCFVNTATCLFAGVVTFSILGHMAYNQGVDIKDVVNSGPGLVFITYPEVVLKLPGGPIWAFVFFVMLVTIGIDSEFCIVESLVTGLVDMFPNQLRPRRRAFTTAVCIFLFLLGCPMVMQGGAFVFQLMDFYSASGITILWCCFFQTIAIGWIFGTQKFADCVEQMTGYKPNLYWIISWAYIAPLVMATIFGFYLIKWKPITYGDIEYPVWAHVIGFGMSLMSMIWIPGFAVYYMFTQKGTFKERLTRGITPNIKSLARVNAPSKKDLKLSESSAKLIRNASSAANVGDQALTKNANSFVKPPSTAAINEEKEEAKAPFLSSKP